MDDRVARELPGAAYAAILIAILVAIVMMLSSQFGDFPRIEFLLPLVLSTTLALSRALSQPRARTACMAPQCIHAAGEPRAAHPDFASASRR